MANQDLLRYVDGIAREKNIEREQIYTDIELAVGAALRKQFNTEDEAEFSVKLDRASGDIAVTRQGDIVPLTALGRIAAQTAKQSMIQAIRQAERGSIYEEYKDRVGTIVTGTVARFEGSTLVVNLGRSEGIMPRPEQIPGEDHQPGERVQALILEVRDTPGGVKIILSRSHPELIRRLFEREVPEVGERTIELKALAREAGHRTKIAVSSIDSKVDAVGACVGVRGSRIKNIVEELGGEKIDIVRWNESSQILISNALKPAEVAEVSLCFELGRATVVVNEDQLSLAIGKRGQNVRLAARLTGWDVDILTPVEFQAGTKRLETTLKEVEGFPHDVVDKVLALGLIDVRDIEEVGAGPLMEELGVGEEVAARAVERCAVEAKKVAQEQAVKKAAEASAKAAAGGDAEKFLAALRGDLDLKKSDDAASESASATEEAATDSERLPGSLEASVGGAPEVTVHKEGSLPDDGELSPEEQAVRGLRGTASSPSPAKVDEMDEVAALAEGRGTPPSRTDEPK